MSLALPPRTARPATRAAGVALALALGLSGCGTGLNAQTYVERATADATNEAIGAINVRNLLIVPPSGGRDTYPAGSNARVTVTFVNSGAQPDRLTSVRSDAARSVAVVAANGSSPAAVTVPGRSQLVNASFLLRGLTRELRPGTFVQMELTFASNGSANLLVPVAVTNRPGPKRSGYEVPHTDSKGQVHVETEEEHGPSGADAPDTEHEPIGDENGGHSAKKPPPAG